MIQTVFAVDGSFYLQWQTDLLAYSHQKTDQPGSLTRLWASDESPTPFAGQTFQTRPYSPHPKTGDVYPPYNTPASIIAWLEKNLIGEEDTVLLAEPDCIFLAPCTLSVARGAPVAQPIGYMNPLSSNNTKLIRHHGFDPQDVQEIGVPKIIHQADLRELAPLWLRYTEMLRDDPVSHELTNPWIVDMWGYVFAAVSLGLRHRLQPVAQSPGYTREDLPDELPLVHYCHDIPDPDTGWKWSKRSYQPWAHVAVPPAGTTRPTLALVDLLNEYAARQGNVLLTSGMGERGIEVTGTLSEEAVTETITEILPDLQKCMEEFGSEYAGPGVFRLTVTPDGTVETATILSDRAWSTSLDDRGERRSETFVQLMLEHLRKARFSTSSGKTVVVVPFTIDDAGGAG